MAGVAPYSRSRLCITIPRGCPRCRRFASSVSKALGFHSDTVSQFKAGVELFVAATLVAYYVGYDRMLRRPIDDLGFLPTVANSVPHRISQN